MEIETNTEPEVQSSGLPSDVAETVSVRDAFYKMEESDFDNDKGLFKGRWNSPNEMADYIKSLEDKHADVIRTQKDSEKKVSADIQADATEAKAAAAKESLLVELAPEFVNNGMQITEEMNTKLVEAGISEAEIKLGAYEYRDRFNAAYDTVGGKAEYDSMMAWAVDGLNDAEKVGFNKDLGNANLSALAIEGLYARYKNGSDESKPERFRGQPNTSSDVKPYANRAELFKDKAYADSNSSNANDMARYKARLAITDQSVYL